MITLLHEIRRNPLLWLLAFVPVVLVAAKLKPEAHTMLFVLSVLAIVPLATLMSHATESVAAKTGDGVGGLLNATLGNLTGGPTTLKSPTTAPSGVCVSDSRSCFQNRHPSKQVQISQSEFEKFRIVQDRLFESDFDEMIKKLPEKGTHL